MPDLYSPGDFDLAGFCVGVVERKRIIDGRTIKPVDVMLGLESAGLHSNGFSLVRKAVFERAGACRGAMSRGGPAPASKSGRASRSESRGPARPEILAASRPRASPTTLA